MDNTNGKSLETEFSKETKPNEIFLYVCERIAEPLIKLEFKHRKSKKDIYKADNNFAYKIWFQPSVKNGGSTKFIVHISVESEKLMLWRKSKYDNPNANGTIITTTLANLTKRQQTLDWYDVSSSFERTRVISEISEQVNNFALPFFKRFEDIDLLINEIGEQGFLPHRFKKSIAYLEQHIVDFVECFRTTPP